MIAWPRSGKIETLADPPSGVLGEEVSVPEIGRLRQNLAEDDTATKHARLE